MKSTGLNGRWRVWWAPTSASVESCIEIPLWGCIADTRLLETHLESHTSNPIIKKVDLYNVLESIVFGSMVLKVENFVAAPLCRRMAMSARSQLQVLGYGAPIMLAVFLLEKKLWNLSFVSRNSNQQLLNTKLTSAFLESVPRQIV